MCSIDGEICEVFNDTWRKAAKAHRCSCCEAIISRGERYLDHFNIFEGEPRRSKFCAACGEAREAFGKAHRFTPAEGWYFFETLRDCIRDDDESEEEWGPIFEALKERMRKALVSAGLKVEEDKDLYQERPKGWWKPSAAVVAS